MHLDIDLPLSCFTKRGRTRFSATMTRCLRVTCRGVDLARRLFQPSPPQIQLFVRAVTRYECLDLITMGK